MKKYYFLIILLLACTFGISAPSQNSRIENAGKQFVNHLEKKEYSKARAMFDDVMKMSMSQKRLEQVWKLLQDQEGPFKRVTRVHKEVVGAYEAVFITCLFGGTSIDVKVVFDHAGHIAGLWFLPTQAKAPASEPPPYANTNLFREKEVVIGTGEWMLPGTLTMPIHTNTPVAAVVLLHGSGPNDRDETVGANKPFRDLAMGLATRGIAVLRFEKRTKQYFKKLTATTTITVKEEVIDDAMSAVEKLRSTPGIDPKQVYILGHSFGGYLAPRIGQDDANIAGLIIVAGSARPLEEVTLDQLKYLISFKTNSTATEKAQIKKLQSEAVEIKNLPEQAEPSRMLLGAPVIYWQDLKKYNAVQTAQKIRQPILILQGERDFQVTQTDFQLWKTGLRGRSTVQFKLYPGLNHLMERGTGKSTPVEYNEKHHVAQVVVDDIAAWIKTLNGTSRNVPVSK